MSNMANPWYLNTPSQNAGVGTVLANPGTIAAPDFSIAAGASLAGGFFGAGFQALAAYQAGQAQKDAYAFAAKVARYQAGEAIKRGEVEVHRFRVGARQFAGSQRARLAAEGADLTEDTAGRHLTDTAYLASLDAQTIINNTNLSAWGFKTQAVGANIAGTDAALAGIGKAAGTLLTGLGETGYRAYTLNREGVFR
jgi:hypothetical protein